MSDAADEEYLPDAEEGASDDDTDTDSIDEKIAFLIDSNVDMCAERIRDNDPTLGNISDVFWYGFEIGTSVQRSCVAFSLITPVSTTLP